MKRMILKKLILYSGRQNIFKKITEKETSISCNFSVVESFICTVFIQVIFNS